MSSHIPKHLNEFTKWLKNLVELHVKKNIQMFDFVLYNIQVRRNVTDVSYHIAQYTNIIQELREEIQRLRHRLHDKSTGSPRPGVNIQAVQGTICDNV